MIVNITNPKKFKSGGRLPRYSNGGYGAWGSTGQMVNAVTDMSNNPDKYSKYFKNSKTQGGNNVNWSRTLANAARIGTAASGTGNYGDALVDTTLSLGMDLGLDSAGPAALVKYGADTLSDTITGLSHNNSATGVSNIGAGAQGAKIGNTLGSTLNLLKGETWEDPAAVFAGLSVNPLVNAVYKGMRNEDKNRAAKTIQRLNEDRSKLDASKQKLMMDKTLLENAHGMGKQSYFMANGGILTNETEAAKAKQVNRLKYRLKSLYGSPWANMTRMLAYGGNESDMTVENSVPLNDEAELVTTPDGSTAPNHGEPNGDQTVYNKGKAVAVTEPGEVIMTDANGEKVVLSQRLGIAQEYQNLESMKNNKSRSSDLMANNLINRTNSKIQSLIYKLPAKQERLKRELGIVNETTTAAYGIGLVPQHGVGKPEIDMLMAKGGKLPKYANGSPTYEELYDKAHPNRHLQLRGIEYTEPDETNNVSSNPIKPNINLAYNPPIGEETVSSDGYVLPITSPKTNGKRRLRSNNFDSNELLAYVAANMSGAAGLNAINKMQAPEDLSKRSYTPMTTTYDINPELANISDTTAMYLDKVGRESTSATGRLSAYRQMLNQSQGEVGKLRANQKQIEQGLREANAKNIADVTDYNKSIDVANKQQKLDFENQRSGAYKKNVDKLADTTIWSVETEDMKKYQNQQLKLQSLLAGDTHVDAITLKALDIKPNDNLLDIEDVRKIANSFRNDDPDKAEWVAEYERRKGSKATITSDGAVK